MSQGMEEAPLVSVITIFLNGDRFIAEAIESVLAQSYSNWELLLIDDGSSDRATAIARDFAVRNPERIRYLEHPGHANRGMSASRNLGLRHAGGEFISYLDADDVWRPNKIADQVRILRENSEAAYVYGPLELWRSWTGRPADLDEIQELGFAGDRIIQPPELLKLFLRNEKHIPSGIMVRARVLERVGGYEESFRDMCEDQIVHAKICLTHPVYACSQSWYRYRQHPDSCNAQAWRVGQFYDKTVQFFTWLEDYLIKNGLARGEVWETLQERSRKLRPSAPVRAAYFLRRQGGRARRFFRKTVHSTRCAFSPPPVILCYHRVFGAEADPHQLCVRPEHFRQHLAVIKKCAQPVTLSHLTEGVTRGSLPRRSVVLTFDDGYLDNLENALPILREFEIPATIYIATDAIGTTEEFWWDDLERLVLHAGNLPEVLRLRINDRMREWRLDLPNEVGARERVFFEIHAELRPLPAQLQADVRAQLRALTKIPSLARPLYRCMNVSELSALAADPLITLGAHTMSHCDLDYRTKDQQEFEIGGSKRRLEEIIGYRVDHFSYPYGSFNRDCLAVCAENNFRSAVAGIESSVRRDSHRFCLPRRFVRDWDGPRFERKLKRAFRG